MCGVNSGPASAHLSLGFVTGLSHLGPRPGVTPPWRALLPCAYPNFLLQCSWRTIQRWAQSLPGQGRLA